MCWNRRHTHDARRRCVSAQRRLGATHAAENRDSPAGGGCGSSGLSPPRFPLKKQLLLRTVREVETGSSRPGHGSELALALSVLPFLHLSLFFQTNFCVFLCCVVAATYWPREVRQHGRPTESRGGFHRHFFRLIVDVSRLRFVTKNTDVLINENKPTTV